MSNFTFEPLEIPGAYIINSFFSEDNRGCFVKGYEKEIFKENNINFNCDESFISISEKYTIRGMHFQLYHPQAKIVSVLSGKVFDVIVDLREDSPTFGKWKGIYLSSGNRTSLLIPRGCAHGFMALSDNAMVNYLCDGKYDKKTDTGILYCDKEIGVKWPVRDISLAIIGERDLNQMSFDYFKNNCRFTYI